MISLPSVGISVSRQLFSQRDYLININELYVYLFLPLSTVFLHQTPRQSVDLRVTGDKLLATLPLLMGGHYGKQASRGYLQCNGTWQVSVSAGIFRPRQ